MLSTHALLKAEIETYKNILLCGCETWCLALRYGLRRCYPVVLYNVTQCCFVCLGENN